MNPPDVRYLYVILVKDTLKSVKTEYEIPKALMNPVGWL